MVNKVADAMWFAQKPFHICSMKLAKLIIDFGAFSGPLFGWRLKKRLLFCKNVVKNGNIKCFRGMTSKSVYLHPQNPVKNDF